MWVQNLILQFPAACDRPALPHATSPAGSAAAPPSIVLLRPWSASVRPADRGPAVKEGPRRLQSAVTVLACAAERSAGDSGIAQCDVVENEQESRRVMCTGWGWGGWEGNTWQ